MEAVEGTGELKLEERKCDQAGCQPRALGCTRSDFRNGLVPLQARELVAGKLDESMGKLGAGGEYNARQPK